MRKLMLLTVFAALAAVLALQSEGSDGSAKGPPVEVRPQYLALGDGLAVGAGASDPATTGYVPQFHGYLRDALDPGRASPPALSYVPDAFSRKFLELNNLGRPGDPPAGETSGSMIAGGQLDAALAELAARNGNSRPVDDVRVVTLDIGGNDGFAVVGPCFGGPTPECIAAIESVLAAFSANFDFILGELRAAAGPDTTILVMTYYNPLVNPDCMYNSMAWMAEIVLEGDPSAGLPAGLNDVIRSVAASHGAGVAETYGVLAPADVHPDCRHIYDSGYGIVAEEFIAAFEG